MLHHISDYLLTVNDVHQDLSATTTMPAEFVNGLLSQQQQDGRLRTSNHPSTVRTPVYNISLIILIPCVYRHCVILRRDVDNISPGGTVHRVLPSSGHLGNLVAILSLKRPFPNCAQCDAFSLKRIIINVIIFASYPQKVFPTIFPGGW